MSHHCLNTTEWQTDSWTSLTRNTSEKKNVVCQHLLSTGRIRLYPTGSKTSLEDSMPFMYIYSPFELTLKRYIWKIRVYLVGQNFLWLLNIKHTLTCRHTYVDIFIRIYSHTKEYIYMHVHCHTHYHTYTCIYSQLQTIYTQTSFGTGAWQAN